jgi:twitching motility protein PilT
MTRRIALARVASQRSVRAGGPSHREPAAHPVFFFAEPGPMLDRGESGRIVRIEVNVLNFNVDVFLKAMLGISDRVSDLNFSVGRPPQVELDGKLRPVKFPGLNKLSPFQTEQIAMHLMQGNKDVIHTLVNTGSTDCSYAIPGMNRFRINIFQQRGTYAIVLRVIATEVPTVEQLGLPTEINNVGELMNGIVLVTGPTGSGKSTTLAALIDKINREKPYHIVTIEDPIEYAHPHKIATVNQREVGSDTGSFGLALRAALRQAPKVILIGEMRDVETIEIAMEAAETGHLVLSTLHTIDASKTIDRIIGVFPKDQEPQIRTRLAQSFRYIISQRLIPKIGGGRTAALEILKSSMRTREYITKGEGEGKSLVDAMRDGSDDGMQEFDWVLQGMVEQELITEQTALAHATNQNNLRLMLNEASHVATTQDDTIMFGSNHDTSGA